MSNITVQHSFVTGLYVHPDSHFGEQEHVGVGACVGHVNRGQVTVLLEVGAELHVVFEGAAVIEDSCTAGSLQMYGFES